MSYRQYSSYKYSGVAWIGEIPAHWDARKLKYLSSIITGYGFSSDDYTNTGVPLIRIGDITTNGTIDVDHSKKLPDEYLKQYCNYCIVNNDILIAMTGATIGKAGHYNSDTPGLLNQRVGKYVPFGIDDQYLWYILISAQYIEYIKLTGFGGAQPNISDWQLLDYHIALPPLPEQQAIATFLDRETARIDTLIDKKERLIALLKEKRQALITRAVTKGLDPDVEMKDSGVEWIGDIPAHWELRRIRYLFIIKKRIAGKLGYYVLSITQRGIVIRDTTNNEGQLSMDYSKYQIVEVGDFAMNHMDLLTGFVDISPYDGVTSPDYRVFSIRDNNVSYPKYNLHLFQMCYIMKIFYSFGKGVSLYGRWRLPANEFNNFIFPVPPLEEQKEISAFLDHKIDLIDKTLEKTSQQITKLRELRKTLISNTVTGKINVREEVQI